MKRSYVQRSTVNQQTGSHVANEFECLVCGEVYKYRTFCKGRNDKTQCLLLEEVFHMDDPFEESSKVPFVVGGICTLCNKTVCVDPKCSVFYTKRFCLECVKRNPESFPKELLKDLT